MLSGGVDMVVILEFSKWKQIRPVVLSLINEDSQILLELLIDSFRLAISVWVLRGGGGKSDS